MIRLRDPSVLIMRCDWRNNSVVTVHNLDSKPREISFDVGLDGLKGRTLSNLLADEHSWAGEDGKHRLVLEAYGYRWFRTGGLDYLLKRTEF